MFAWEAYEHGTDIHLQADPTKIELLSKAVKTRKEETKSSAKENILEKYGGEEHLQAPPKQLLMAQTVSYRKSPKFLDSQNVWCKHTKIQTKRFYHRVLTASKRC